MAALPPKPQAPKHAGVGRTLTPRLRTLITALCVALSFVFASASAASVVDRVQHSTRMAHEHGGQLAFSVAEADHHADHHVAGDQPDDNGGPADHEPGAGHHHSDAPAGVLSAVVPSGQAVVATQLTLRLDGAETARGIRPGGLERPPKAIANLD